MPIGINALYANLVKETSTDTGIGAIDLDGAVSGFRTFASVFADFSYVSYCIVCDNGDYEFGVGQMRHSTPNFISRLDANVYDSSSSNNVISLPTGSKTVFCGPTSIHGSMNAYRINIDSQSYADASNLAFDSVENDPWSAADSTLPTTKLLVPDWAAFMRVTGSATFGTGNTGKARLALEKLTGSTYTDSLESFGCYQNTAYIVDLAIATGWFAPSSFSSEYGIQIEVDVTTTVNISGVLNVEWRE